ncbi:hypothetical protein AVEN_88016-1 [Araneus ventricosus]|uniref:HTH CENPB-type domain-containing protein n=1 Tax=Araneus ventricosus TaxID=182803 RepID=A0A4Y2WXS4_ARAVE|nr:hypothetical protein AVEN_88016-1 [Araneus ventricosus]
MLSYNISIYHQPIGKNVHLKKVDENQHLKGVDLAKELGLPVSALNTLIYKRKIIGESHHQSGSSAPKKLRVQSGKFAVVEKGLLQWFNQCRTVKIPIRGPLLKEKAQEISKLDVECDTSSSSGWLHKIKLRHGITGKTVSGESEDVDCETVDDLIQNKSPDLIKGYEQKDIFNADEIARRKGVDGFSVETVGPGTHPFSPSSDSLTLPGHPLYTNIAITKLFVDYVMHSSFAYRQFNSNLTCGDPMVLPYELIRSRNRGTVHHIVRLPIAWQVLDVYTSRLITLTPPEYGAPYETLLSVHLFHPTI